MKMQQVTEEALKKATQEIIKDALKLGLDECEIAAILISEADALQWEQSKAPDAAG